MSYRGEPPVLEGQNVRLRPMADRDVETRAKLGVNREIVRAFGGDTEGDSTMTEPEARAQLDRSFGLGPHWVIADRNDLFIGTTRLAPIDETTNSASFAIGIQDPNLLGQGLGTETVRLVVSYGLEQLKLDYVTLTVLAENARAIKSYAKCGFDEYDRTEESLWRDNRWHADVHMRVDASTFTQ